jgi:hypothetical protein
MPAFDAIAAAITRLAPVVETTEEVLQLAEAFDKLQHAGEEPKEGFAASGSDMLDASANFADEGDRMGFRPRRGPRA